MGIRTHQANNNSQETSDTSTWDQLTGLAGVTWSGWFNFQALGSSDTAWARWGLFNTSWAFENDNANDDKKFIMGGVGNHFVFAGPARNIAIEKWYNIVVRYDGTAAAASRLAMWVDGVKVQAADITVTGTIPTTLPASNQGISLGADGQAGTEGRNSFAELAIWNVALTDDECSGLYTRLPIEVRISKLFVYWPLRDKGDRTDMIKSIAFTNQQANDPDYQEHPSIVSDIFLGA